MKKEKKYEIKPLLWVIFFIIFTLIPSFISQSRTNLQSESKFRILNPNSIIRRGDISVPQIYQSEVTAVELGNSLNSGDFELVIFGENYKFNKNGFAFVGIDVAQKPGDYLARLINPINLENVDSVLVRVLKKDFFQSPSIKGLRGCESPDKEKERKAIRGALALGYGLASQDEDGLSMPLAYIKTIGDFGVFRGNRQHRGVDLRGDGTDVFAVDSGVVLLAGRFSLEGNLVIINHGGGVLSMYMHLSEIFVKQWQEMKKGEIIGLVGDTGCVNGPHLDFRVIVHGATVDPLNYISVVNKYSSQSR